MSLATRYLGLQLAHPIVAAASPLTATLDGMRGLTIVNSLRDVTMDDLAALPAAEPSSAGGPPRFERRTVILAGLVNP